LYFQLHAFVEHEVAIVGNLNFSKLDVSSAISAARLAKIQRGGTEAPVTTPAAGNITGAGASMR
jgi:hypothetical protein